MLIKQTTQMTDSERIATENSNNQFLQSLSFVAVGTIYPFAGSTIPDTFMLCDGSALDTTEYSELFSVIGYTYGGSGDSFNIPDLRGKVLVGCDSSDTSFNALGKKGGAKEVTLTVAQMPEHEGHLYQNVTDIEAGPPPIGSLAGYLGKSIMTAHPSSGRGWNSVAGNEVVPAGVSRGGDQPHENMPPYMVCNYIIKVNQGISTDDFRLPIDQTYTPTSPNAQSGLATAEAVGVANDYTDKAIKSSKNYANNTFAPAIKNTVSGGVLAVHDVSPAEHDLEITLSSEEITDFSTVKVNRYGKNLLNINCEESVPNNTAQMATNPRKFVNGTYIIGMTRNNIYLPKVVTAEFANNELTITATTEYHGVGFSLKLRPNTNYTISCETDDVTKMSIGVGFYDDNGEYLYDVSTWNDNTKSFTTDSYGNVLIVLCPTVTNQPITFSNIQLEVGKAVTEYEEYKGVQTVVANTDGTVEGLTSVSPNMTVLTDTEGVVIDMTYNADTKMYIDNKLAEISTAIVNNV